MKLHAPAIAGGALWLAGCASVLVLASPSMNADGVTTNEHGETRVPETVGVQNVSGVIVTKDGYETASADKKTSGTTTVTLRRK